MPILARAGAAAARGFGMLGKIAAAVDEYFKYVTLLLPGNGTNGAQNNTFLDSSTNNFTITRNGNTTQGTFSPYGTLWSNYFDGTGDYLSFTKQTTTSAFTCECWFYRGENVSGYHIVFSGNNLGSVNADNAQLSVSNAGAVGLTLAGTAVIAQTGTAVIKNQWNHIAWVRSGTSCAIFVNGSRIATGTSSSALNVVSVGTYLSGYEPNGYVSNARINTTAVYDPSLTTCTVPTAPLTAITGTYLLTCQSNRFVDNSASPLTITVNGNPSVQRFSPFAPTAPYAASTDGGSGYFDGSGDYLSISDNAAFDLGSGAFTLEVWAYMADVTPSKAEWFISQWLSDTGNSWGFRVETDGTLNFFYSTDGNNATTVGTASPGLVANAWHHIAVVRSGNTVTIYVDGVSKASATVTATFFNSSASVMIGNQAATGFGQTFTGYIASARVVKGTAVYTSTFTPPTAPLTAITNTSLLCNFTNAGILDNAEMNNLETVGNAQISTAQSKFGGGSMAFDGSGDYLVSNPATSNLYAFGTGDFTIEFWINPTTTSGGIQIIYEGRPFSVNGAYPTIYLSGTTLVYYANDGERISGGTISTGVFSHIAVSRSGTSTRMFLNGTQVGSTYTDSTNYLGAAGAPRIWIGAFTSTTIAGYIDDLRITKGYARYTTSFTAPTAPFPLS